MVQLLIASAKANFAASMSIRSVFGGVALVLEIALLAHRESLFLLMQNPLSLSLKQAWFL